MHRPQEELIKELAKAYQQVNVGGLYYHYKNHKNLYKVLTLAVIEANDSISVIYEAQYGYKIVFVRPLKSWLEKVQWKGKIVDRFTFVKQA
ncbi:MAG: DUF1653 domain-containing protein [Candidatus Saccharimonadales bacterium]